MKSSEIEAAITTAVVFGLVTIGFYLLIIRPLIRRPAVATANAAGALGATSLQHGENRRQIGTPQQQSMARAGSLQTAQSQQEEGFMCRRVPVHLSNSSASQAIAGGEKLLADGLVPFRNTKAACYEKQQVLDPEAVSNTRKERARVLARLLNDNLSTDAPPPRGCTFVVSIHINDVSCSKLRRVLYLLATYYNLLVIVAGVDSSFDFLKDRKKMIRLLRGPQQDLVDAVLPGHRIVFASTVAGRVAFVRQLQRIEIMLDFDPEVKELLNRFGHKVIIYGKDNDGVSGTTSISRLGSALI